VDIDQKIWDGTTLSKEEARKLELLLEQDPAHTEYRANLVGYYFAHHYCCHSTRFKRLKHIIWIIENLTPFSHGIACFMELSMPERTSYQAIKKAFEKRLAQSPTAWEVMAEAAYFVTHHDPELAERLYMEALGMNHDAERLQTLLQNLRQNKKSLLDNKNHYAKIPEREYLAYAAPCRHPDARP
jgi:hypothetical protein